MNQCMKRLTALEVTERARRFPDITAGLLISYATPDERAAWAAAGRPENDQGTWGHVLEKVYDESV
jgi:hypothetical protein